MDQFQHQQGRGEVGHSPKRTSTDIWKTGKESAPISPSNVAEVIDILREDDIFFAVAPFEADWELTYFPNIGAIHAMIASTNSNYLALNEVRLTGGDIALQKCFWQLIPWVLVNGRLQLLTHMDKQLTMEDGRGASSVIDFLGPNQPNVGLGVDPLREDLAPYLQSCSFWLRGTSNLYGLCNP